MGSDVILLAGYFFMKYSKEMRKEVKRISTSTVESVLSYKWPGNVLELENCSGRAVLLTKTDTINCAHLPPSLQLRGSELSKKDLSKLCSGIESQ